LLLIEKSKALAQKNIILVDFATPEEAHNAMRFVKSGLTLFDQQLHVSFSKYPVLSLPSGVFTDSMRDYTQLPRLHRYPQGIASDRVRWITVSLPSWCFLVADVVFFAGADCPIARHHDGPSCRVAGARAAPPV